MTRVEAGFESVFDDFYDAIVQGWVEFFVGNFSLTFPEFFLKKVELNSH